MVLMTNKERNEFRNAENKRRRANPTPFAAKKLQYSPSLPIVNAGSLPRGTGAKYLVCVVSHVETFIAKSWHHKLPACGNGEVVIEF